MHSNALALLHSYSTALHIDGATANESKTENNSNRQTNDRAQISDDGKQLLEREEHSETSKTAIINELTPQEEKVVQELQMRDRAVRQHEQAHKAVAGAYALGGIHYQYETGPDGKRYAVGGHVSIDTGKEADPQATIRKMDTIRRAALAPAEPSPQDRAVAAQATQQKLQAVMELRLEQTNVEQTQASDHPNANTTEEIDTDDRQESKLNLLA